MLPSAACIKRWHWLRRTRIGHAAVFVDDHGATAFATLVHNIRGPVFQSLVRSFAVVEGEVSRQPSMQLANRGIPVEVHLLVLDVALRVLNEDVVQRSAPPVHTDVNAFTF
jgi:hypothetical protein